ncbi:MAG: class I SAM-dependent methyltransferase [Promethearchaeota archaeon]|jgi:ubiquinone/menaquinone biosynthesis C-methylase UbiE
MKIPKELLYPAPLYTFLTYISESEVSGQILDCGSGGPNPKQALFALIGFDIIGIEVSEEMFDMAQEYAKTNKIDLNMQMGDMRAIPFETNYFSHVYSWNTIFHMNKKDIKQGVDEMIRVLKPGGLCFVNFLSTDSEHYGKGEEPNPGEYVEIIDGRKVMHTYFDDEEPDRYFENLPIEFLFKQKRSFIQKLEDRVYQESQFDYIVQKKSN